MVKRKLSLKKYGLAFILTLVVFLGGIIVGMVLENARLAEAKQTSLAEKVNLQSIQLQQKYIDSGLADCQSLNQILESNIDELTKKMNIVIGYSKGAIFNQEEFQLQLQDYFLTEIQFLLISQEIDKKCPRNNVRVVYFYNENQNDIQGRILDYLKLKFGERLLVFSFDSNFLQEPMINILLTSYNIKTFPAVVVENQVFEGQTTLEELIKTICQEFKKHANIPKECSIF